MGFAYSLLAASLWPMVSLIIPEHQLGTAYGFMQAIQNLGLAVISLVAGIIVDDKVRYSISSSCRVMNATHNLVVCVCATTGSPLARGFLLRVALPGAHELIASGRRGQSQWWRSQRLW